MPNLAGCVHLFGPLSVFTLLHLSPSMAAFGGWLRPLSGLVFLLSPFASSFVGLGGVRAFGRHHDIFVCHFGFLFFFFICLPVCLLFSLGVFCLSLDIGLVPLPLLASWPGHRIFGSLFASQFFSLLVSLLVWGHGGVRLSLACCTGDGSNVHGRWRRRIGGPPSESCELFGSSVSSSVEDDVVPFIWFQNFQQTDHPYSLRSLFPNSDKLGVLHG